jgi:hypothetical protein
VVKPCRINRKLSPHEVAECKTPFHRQALPVTQSSAAAQSTDGERQIGREFSDAIQECSGAQCSSTSVAGKVGDGIHRSLRSLLTPTRYVRFIHVVVDKTMHAIMNTFVSTIPGIPACLSNIPEHASPAPKAAPMFEMDQRISQ